jgi:hypothetical protein
VRAVLDTNVIISALLSRDGSPARVLLAWQSGAFELIVSRLLLDEVRHVLDHPKLRHRIPPEDADAIVEWLARAATLVPDPARPPPIRAADPDDDYLIALAAEERAVLVSGDAHLLDLSGRIPVHSAAEFVELLEGPGNG